MSFDGSIQGGSKMQVPTARVEKIMECGLWQSMSPAEQGIIFGIIALLAIVLAAVGYMIYKGATHL